MKHIIKRGCFLTLMFMLLGCLSLYAADNDLITKQITINLEKAGTLPDRIGSSKKYKITNLKIIGEINGTDLRMIRDMAGSSSNGNSTDGKLSVLDLSKAKIVEGGDCYYIDYYTSNDVIGSYAFSGCNRLTSLTLPAGINEIGSYAFKDCSGLTSIYVYAEKVPQISSNAFEEFDAKKCTLYVPMGTRDDYRLSDFGYYFENIVGFEATGIDKITIKLEKAGTLPDRIGSSKKYKITNLKIIGEINGTDLRMIREMAGSNSTGNSTDGKLSVLDLSEAKIVKGGNSYYNNYNTSNDVIGNHAFSYCSGLTSLNLPVGITKIGYSAFEGCSGLTSLNLPAGITEIGYDAFRDCSGLTSLNLPAGITEIGDGAFYGCSRLTSLTLPDGITKIGDRAFFNCYRLTSLTLPDGITEIGNSAFFYCSGLTNLTIPAGITEISYGVFYTCSGLTSLNLPAGITSIGDDAFRNCSGLTSLNLPAGITSIGEGAFYGCSGLTSLNLPAGITSIGIYAFVNCSGLTSLTLPAGITEISEGAFFIM